jgi:hypothetical protein
VSAPWEVSISVIDPDLTLRARETGYHPYCIQHDQPREWCEAAGLAEEFTLEEQAELTKSLRQMARGEGIARRPEEAAAGCPAGGTEEKEVSCTCPHIMVDHVPYPPKSWSDTCPEHGVGSEYFQGLDNMPYGYASERHTTREEWLDLLRQERERADAENAAWEEMLETEEGTDREHL